MSKTVTIPSSPNPKWECKINEVSYSYLSGSTQEVPDEVADLIEQINASIPQESGKNAPLVPSPSVADAGKAIVVGEDGKYELGEGGGTGGEVYISFTDFNSETNSHVYTIKQRLPKIGDLVTNTTPEDASDNEEVITSIAITKDVFYEEYQINDYDGTRKTINATSACQFNNYYYIVLGEDGKYYLALE